AGGAGVQEGAGQLPEGRQGPDRSLQGSARAPRPQAAATCPGSPPVPRRQLSPSRRNLPRSRTPHQPEKSPLTPRHHPPKYPQPQKRHTPPPRNPEPNPQPTRQPKHVHRADPVSKS